MQFILFKCVKVHYVFIECVQINNGHKSFCNLFAHIGFCDIFVSTYGICFLLVCPCSYRFRWKRYRVHKFFCSRFSCTYWLYIFLSVFGNYFLAIDPCMQRNCRGHTSSCIFSARTDFCTLSSTWYISWFDLCMYFRQMMLVGIFHKIYHNFFLTTNQICSR